MAPKKKKKPAANPARGFATTSVASKPKPDKKEDTPTEALENETGVATEVSESIQVQGDDPKAPRTTKDDHQVTPEELEAQLELDELQLLVEKHAAKVRRDASRQMTRIQTDRRVLRAQAQPLATRDWLSADLKDAMIDLAKLETGDLNQISGHQSFLKSMPEEEGTLKLWTLRQALTDLTFSPNRVEQALKWLCAHPVNADSAPYIWGLQECLEFLALECDEEQLLPYESALIPKTGVAASTENSRPGTPLNIPQTFENVPPIQNHASSIHPSRLAPMDDSSRQVSAVEEVDVSDLDSDMEPDQLVPKYLDIKTRLFEISPEAVEPKHRRNKSKRQATSTLPESSSSVRKLQAQLRHIEADALFDQYDADTKWMTKRNQLAQDRITSKKLGLEETHAPVNTTYWEPRQSQGADKETATSSTSLDVAPKDEEDDPTELSMFSEMFSPVPDDDSAISAPEVGQDSTSQTIKLRDFGKQSGLTPRRVLEETVRARDPEAKLAFKLVSPTTYACRHSLVVRWSKDQEVAFEEDIPGVQCDAGYRSVTFTAVSISTPSVQQSEAYISTAALYSIFSGSTKEDKSYIRLPSVWRDLYKEFLEVKKDRNDALDRATIKELRSIVKEQVDREEDEGVVLTNRFRKRNQASGAVSEAEDSGRDEARFVANAERLKELWAQKSRTPAYQRMLVSRMNLPIFAFRAAALQTIDHHQVTIVCGETGCGKSTQLPAFILENELSKGKPCKIYCTEPRRISAISLAQRVSEELGEFKNELGTSRSLVGYAIRLESNTSAQTRLVYATVGIVLRMLESSRGLDDITHLIIDEVHERSIDTDFLLIILRSLMERRPELKVVLMSATVDAQRFSRYLNNAPILNVPGRTFPVQTKFLEDAVELTHYSSSKNDAYNDSDTSENEDAGSEKTRSGIPKSLPGYSNTTRSTLATYDEYRIDYSVIVRLIEQVSTDPNYYMYSKAFLVFLPGIAEIRQLNNILLGHPPFKDGWLIHPLHSTISSEDQQQAFLLPPSGMRKIVLATNIAETGVTIPDITCVIDTGKHKEMRFDERRQLSRLTQSFISRANAKQRRGRAGRVQEGLCFHLFTKLRHDELMADQQTPEMLRLSLQDLVMRTKICKLGDIEQTLASALDPPSSKNIRRAIDALIEVDALTSAEELTPLGRQLAKLPLDAHLGKLVLIAGIFNCVDVAITIAAILSSKSPFLTPMGSRQRADLARLTFKRGDSDLLTAYNAYKTWKNVCQTPGSSEMSFCHKNFLSSQNLANIEDLKSQLLSSLVDAGFVQLPPDERRALSRYRNTRFRSFVSFPASYDANSNNDALINSVIAAAFYPKILTRDGKGWRNIANNQSVSLAPTSVNKGTRTAQFLSYYHIMQSSSRFYNAHSTSVAHALPMVLLAGSDADFRLHAGVVLLNSNSLRFVVRDWKTVVALKLLRARVRDIVNAAWKAPGRQLSSREQKWMGLFVKVFELEMEKSERIEKTKVRSVGGVK